MSLVWENNYFNCVGHGHIYLDAVGLGSGLVTSLSDEGRAWTVKCSPFRVLLCMQLLELNHKGSRLVVLGLGGPSAIFSSEFLWIFLHVKKAINILVLCVWVCQNVFCWFVCSYLLFGPQKLIVNQIEPNNQHFQGVSVWHILSSSLIKKNIPTLI